MSAKSILFLTGSLNQTTQMQQIASNLPEFECYFSQFFSDNPVIASAIKMGILDNTVMGRPLRYKSEEYMRAQGMNMDYQAKDRKYDLVVFCSDLLFPKKFEGTKTLWVQEGMIDPFTSISRIIQKLKLPRYLSIGTSLNGTSNLCDIYCVASEGYRNYIIKHGTDANKVVVTGIPNYDHLEKYRHNNFPYSGYVMVATSDMRETYRPEDRVAFLKTCMEIAQGRQLLIKLHPNEQKERAIQEIKQTCPSDTLIYTDGNTHEMIANCEELITQYSTVVYAGLALQKPVHSYFDLKELNALLPIQNGGSSAKHIASICRDYLFHDGPKEMFINKLNREPISELDYAN
ncbi:MAG: hypothetical protein RLZ91_1792 [Bacteroidota bacterium]